MTAFASFGSFTAQPGKEQALLSVLMLAAEFMKTYPGCEEYRVYHDAAEKGKIWISEVWVSEEAHTNCLKDPRVNEATAKGALLILDMPNRFTLIPID